MDKIVLIDADGLVYHSSKDTLEESIEILDSKVRNIFEATGTSFYAMFISKGKYFRHEIYPDYKAARGRYQTQLKWVKTLKSYLSERWGAEHMYGVEADDLVSYWHNKKFYLQFDAIVCSDEPVHSSTVMETIISSPDKDILQSIPGKHFNYTYKLEEKDNPDSVIKGWWVETSEEEAQKFKFYQLIVGDTSDGVKGVEGRGKVFFEKTNEWTFSKVLETYIERYGASTGIYELQKNQRLLHLLNSEEDFYREVGILPPVVKIRPVEYFSEKETTIEINEDLF